MNFIMLGTTLVDDVTSSLTTVADDITGVLGAIAPIALGIVGVFLVWRYGMRFFKSLSK